jgi:hypothetical protein
MAVNLIADLVPPVTPEWRARVDARMKELNISVNRLAHLAGTSQAAVSYVLTRAKSSALVPRIDAALASARRQPDDPRPSHAIAEAAVLREARDAISADIVRLEDVRATVEERLAEAYEHRAKLDIRIRELRADGGAS